MMPALSDKTYVLSMPYLNYHNLIHLKKVLSSLLKFRSLMDCNFIQPGLGRLGV